MMALFYDLRRVFTVCSSISSFIVSVCLGYEMRQKMCWAVKTPELNCIETLNF